MFLSLLLLCFFFASPSRSQPPDELRSLLEFKKGIHSDPSGLLSSWSASDSPSDATSGARGACAAAFQGVTCSGSGSVVSISLPALNLSGDLHLSTLLPLRSLRNLSLHSNALSGRLTPALFSLPSLEHLDLSSNLFYGPVPAKLSELSALSHLNLSHNRLSGGFPVGLGNLPQLKVLDVRSNGFWGDAGLLLSELRSTEHLDLSKNRFFGRLDKASLDFSELANAARYVDLSGNDLSGGFLSSDSMSLFRSLEVLDLGFNQLTGLLPEMDLLLRLRVFRAGNNKLYGSLPGALFGDTMPLEELDLSGNGFTGFIHNINSTSLKVLNLSWNALSGSLPSNLGSCSSLDLSNNMLTGDLSVMANWENTLEVIDLSSNTLSGNFPQGMLQFNSLTSIRIRNNSLVGSLPSIMGSYPKLALFDLSWNKLSGSISQSFFLSETLINLNLSGNQLTEALPLQRLHSAKSVSSPSYTQLESMDLSYNLLSGTLAPEVGDLQKLKFLNLGKNVFSGELPGELSKLSDLEFLDLSNNHFKGKIPDLPLLSLKVFNVSFNDLEGTVPQSLRRFPSASFHPGNALLVFVDGIPTGKDNSGAFASGGQRHGLKAGVRVALIVGSIGIVMAILFVLMAFFMIRSDAISGGKVFRLHFTGRDVNGGRIGRPNIFKSPKNDPVPTSMSFSNDHLLTSASRSMSAQKEFLTGTVEYGFSDSKEGGSGSVRLDSLELCPPSNERFSSSEAMVSSSHMVDSRISEQPVMLEVYSPDRLAGELFFLDGSSVFTAEELSRAPAEVLGRSSHGTSYKATLDNGHLLSVKWLRVGLVKRKKEFAKEVKKVGAIRHPNIISWKAYYWGPREQERLIISDYVDGDSLALYLHESTPRRYSRLSVRQRLRIAIDVTRCLYHLHHERCLPHGNLKPTNILLTGPELTARLMDYGLHRLMTPNGTSEQILNMGALGYRAPELATSKPLPSFKADVYSFGVILMEMLTRRSAGDIISGQSGAVDLADWVHMCAREGRGTDCFDRDIAGLEESPRVMDELLAVSLKCILPVNERPDIKTVFEDLCSITP